jgi:hypothetical protein
MIVPQNDYCAANIMQDLLSMFADVAFLQLKFKNHEKVILREIYHITLQEFVFNDDQKRVGPVSPESGFLNRDRVKARRFFGANAYAQSILDWSTYEYQEPSSRLRCCLGSSFWRPGG